MFLPPQPFYKGDINMQYSDWSHYVIMGTTGGRKGKKKPELTFRASLSAIHNSKMSVYFFKCTFSIKNKENIHASCVY